MEVTRIDKWSIGKLLDQLKCPKGEAATDAFERGLMEEELDELDKDQNEG